MSRRTVCVHPAFAFVDPGRVALQRQHQVVGTVVATLTSLGSVSLPGTVSYVSAIAPVSSAIGAPVAPLGLLVAVETLPDIMRTVGNVTWDLAATTWLSRRAGKVPLDEADTILRNDG